MSTEIRVALVFEQEAGSQALRAALANAGVHVVQERKASQLGGAALAEDVDAIVVNLDPELEELLDEVTDVLDRASQPVIFNDPAASSDLSGWDRARWLRHLSAKLKGKTDVTPPPPPGAQAIPVPVRAPEPAAVPAERPASPAAVEPAASAAPAAPAPAIEPAAELNLADLDLMFEPAETPAAAAGPALTVGEDIGDLDSFFAEAEGTLELETAAEPVATPVATALPDTVELEAPAFDLDTLFTEAPGDSGPDVKAASAQELNELDALFAMPAEAESAREPAPASAQSDLGDLDALFAAPPAEPEAAPAAQLASPSELNDLDALFREFEAGEKQAPAPAPAPAARSAPAEPPKVEPPKFSMDWSLEEIEDKSAAPAIDVGKLIAESRLDAPAKPLARTPPPAPAPAPAPKVAPVTPSTDGYADFKLEELDFTLDAPPAAAAAPAAAAEELAAFDLSGLELSQDYAGATEAPASADSADALAITDIDFDFDLGGAPEAAAGSAPAADGGLDDLDSLFEPAPSAKVPALALPDLNRLFVLGASIGGPEAIKAFLGRLPANVPAAFIVAQHMGSEFLELMATQLDAATPLSVRFPKSGERLRHGEVVVAPASEQMTLDDRGHLRMVASVGNSPYSPSIDQLVRDAADRFGEHATLILFSGMGTDAIEGGRYLAARGGQVWAQERSSCVIATMIDSAKQQGLLRFEGSPVQLAERVLESLIA